VLAAVAVVVIILLLAGWLACWLAFRLATGFPAFWLACCWLAGAQSILCAINIINLVHQFL
jgi:hypothetical protein